MALSALGRILLSPDAGLFYKEEALSQEREDLSWLLSVLQPEWADRLLRTSDVEALETLRTIATCYKEGNYDALGWKPEVYSSSFHATLDHFPKVVTYYKGVLERAIKAEEDRVKAWKVRQEVLMEMESYRKMGKAHPDQPWNAAAVENMKIREKERRFNELRGRTTEAEQQAYAAHVQGVMKTMKETGTMPSLRVSLEKWPTKNAPPQLSFKRALEMELTPIPEDEMELE
jgi:hypothetical protein